jgi:hypothetical protein
MNQHENRLPKIFYNGEEVKQIKIILGDFDYRIFVNPYYKKDQMKYSGVHLSYYKKDQMKYSGVHLSYENIPKKKDGDRKIQDDEGDIVTYWEIEDKQDKITIDQNDTCVMIKWMEGNNDNRVKQSLFVRMKRILHIVTNEEPPDFKDDITK